MKRIKKSGFAIAIQHGKLNFTSTQIKENEKSSEIKLGIIIY